MNSLKTLFTVALLGLLTQACGSTQPAETPMQLSQYLQNFRDASSYAATNAFTAENTMTDKADGTASLWFSSSERRKQARSVISITVSTEKRLYMTEGVDTLYIKGPSPDLGIQDDAWYVTTDTALKRDLLNGSPARALDEFLSGSDNLDAAFSLQGSEQFDGQTCNVYVATGETMPREKVIGLEKLLSRADDIQYRVVLCEDGLPHLVHLTATGLGLTDKTQPGSIDIRLHFFDFGKEQAIVLPADARSIDSPR